MSDKPLARTVDADGFGRMRELLARPIDPVVVALNTRIVAQPDAASDGVTRSLLVFELGGEQGSGNPLPHRASLSLGQRADAGRSLWMQSRACNAWAKGDFKRHPQPSLALRMDAQSRSFDWASTLVTHASHFSMLRACAVCSGGASNERPWRFLAL